LPVSRILPLRPLPQAEHVYCSNRLQLLSFDEQWDIMGVVCWGMGRHCRYNTLHTKQAWPDYCSTDNGTRWAEFLTPLDPHWWNSTPSYFGYFCASGDYLFWRFWVEDCCPPPFASIHRVSTIDTNTGGQMNFPPGFGPYGDYMSGTFPPRDRMYF